MYGFMYVHITCPWMFKKDNNNILYDFKINKLPNAGNKLTLGSSRFYFSFCFNHTIPVPSLDEFLPVLLFVFLVPTTSMASSDGFSCSCLESIGS